nr:6914_t:CDS:2 [Entrophospora candida]
MIVKLDIELVQMIEQDGFIPDEEDDENLTVTHETLTHETNTRSSVSSLPASFLNDFDRLNLTRERMQRYDDEISTTTSTETTTTSAATPTLTSAIAPDTETGATGDRRRERIRFKREKAIFQALNNIESALEVDLCYVLDCTGSMAGHIAATKDCILQVTDYIKNTNPSIKIQVGFCGYRDFCDGSNRLQVFDFTESHEVFKANLATVAATGGGDGPEDVLGGLDAALNQMTWRNGTRVLLHIGDYPPHGRRFTDMQDDHPDGDPNGLTAESVLQKMQSESILYFFGKITEYTDKMVQVFESIIGEIPVFDLVGGDPIELINKFTRAATSSITISVSLTSTLGSRSRDVYSLRQIRRDMNPDVPNWDAIPSRKGVVLYYFIPRTMDEIKDPGCFRKSNLFSKNFSFKIAPQPFSAGVEKYAYFALNTRSNPHKRLVLKEYLKDGRTNPFERYLEAVEISTVATYLSIRFNAIARQKVNFLNVELIRATIDTKTHYYISEPELQDATFKRFNVNSGVIVEFRPTLEAFAHFTYETTGGYLVVYDLQGIELTDRFLLTDSAIHCTDILRFGKTNLGRDGINRCFLKNHKCNEICKSLRLRNIG